MMDSKNRISIDELIAAVDKLTAELNTNWATANNENSYGYKIDLQKLESYRDSYQAKITAVLVGSYQILGVKPPHGRKVVCGEGSAPSQLEALRLALNDLLGKVEMWRRGIPDE